MKLGRWLLALASLSSATPASADEPWADPDPGAPPKRLAVSDIGVRGGAEYRAQLVYVNPISLNTTTDRRAAYIDHRLRLDLGVDYKDVVRLTASADALSGVLWGDNGSLDKEPKTTSGANVNTRNVNSARPCVAFREGDPLSPNAYGYALCPASDFFVRRAYGDVKTPIGLLRVGRQAFTQGMSTAVADGDG